ncbi:F0F1 ATP synthase subunit A [Crocinitomix algicola]|uniref:F0F1 ATP synthase subunit A n=1 Tax=Crocinitomix algicola TaxID=1740263 RepID=UPI0008341B50|nr:F0F1 ATP synthase subunit A [Crocinitomix algicola]
MATILRSTLLVFLLGVGVISKAQHGHEELNHDAGHEHEEVQTDEHHEEEGGFDALHHVMDAHDVHLWGEGESSFSIPLPVILWTDNGLVTFMSSAFHHDDAGHHVVNRNGMNFVKSHGKIYQLNQGAEHAEFDAEHHITNAVKPLDISITKNVFAIFCVAIIMILVFRAVGKQYRGKEVADAPTGIAAWMEPMILFVRDFSIENIGEHKYVKFMPYLLTVFFFIWFGNMFGLIPFLGGINMTGSISITLTLAAFTLIIQLVNAKGPFWKHIFAPPGVPVALYPILVPIELIGMFVKPAALTIRLFANITAGHIIILSLLGIIFTYKNMAWAGLAVPMALFISVLEILVAFLQAYIFTMLSAMFIGAAVDDGHH